MRTAPLLSECIGLRCKAPACFASRLPAVCPPGCPKESATQAVLQQSYKDIHAPVPPGGCLDCLRQEVNQPNYHSPRPCPPGTKPIPDRPLGRSSCDKIESSDRPFLDTFDCHEQPWRSSKHRVEEHHDHGCQNVWKPTIRLGKMTGDNLGEFGQPQPEQEWRSSRTYIPSAHDYGKAWNWRPCIRQVGADRKHCDNTEWRSSVHVAGPPAGDLEKPHSNCIRAPASYSTTWKETSSPPFRPSLRYIPEFYPERRDWRIAKGHVCSKQCVHELQESAYIHGQNLENDTKELHTAKKFTPYKEHQCNKHSYCLPVDDPPLSTQCPPEAGGQNLLPADRADCTPRLSTRAARCTLSGHPEMRRGKKLISLPDDTGDRKRTCRKRRVEVDKSSAVLDQRECDIFEPLVREHQIQPLPHVQRDKRKPFAPQGKFNEYVIDGHFHGCKQPKPAFLTEQRSQFTTSKPWLRKQIYDDMNQASRENKFQCWSVSSSLTRHLYEDRNAVVL